MKHCVNALLLLAILFSFTGCSGQRSIAPSDTSYISTVPAVPLNLGSGKKGGVGGDSAK